MRRAFGGYSAYIFDMDGTLYYQRAMRLRMLFRLLGRALSGPGGLREVRTVRLYRSLREDPRFAASDDADGRIFAELARRTGRDGAELRRTVERWMIESPNRAVSRSRDAVLLDVLAALRRAGKRVFIYSDYPAGLKCEALGVTADGLYHPDGRRITRLKPDPQGLKVILADHGLAPDEALMIGNRDDRDGAAARAAGIDCLILSNSRFRRTLFYRGGTLHG